MATKIQPISKTKTLDYSNELLHDFWILKSNLYTTSNEYDLLTALSSVQEGIVCIQTETLSDKNLIKQIFDIAQNLNIRFYILVNQYSQELDLLHEVCLIRYEAHNIGSLILNPNAEKPQGLFFTGQLTEQSIALPEHLVHNLDAKETKDLFRHFCFHFWETAKKEVIEKGKKQDVTSKPFKVFHDPNTFGEKNFVHGTLFEFTHKATRSDLLNKQISYLNKEKQIPIQIKPKTSIDLEDNVCKNLVPKNEFENLEPNFTDDTVSVHIEYNWKNIPYYLAEKASKHPLYERWEKKTTEIIKSLDSLLSKISDTEKKEITLSKAITRFFLGKKTVFNSLKNEIDQLKAIPFHNLPQDKLKEKIKHINDIYAQLENEIGEIDAKDREAKLQEKIEELNAEIDTQEKEKQHLLNIKQQKETEKAKLEQDITEKETQLNALKNTPEEKITSTLNHSITELKEKIKQLFLGKISDDLSRIEKRIHTLKIEIQHKEKEKNKPIHQHNSSSLRELISEKNSKQNTPTKSPVLQMPDFNQYPQLPQVGELFQFNNKPYLAIEFWEEFEQGKKEAERLNATLCAIKN